MDGTKKWRECLEELGISESEFLEGLEVSGKKKEFIIYRLGLNGQEMHTYEETAEYFSISVERVKQLEGYILRPLLRNQYIRSMHNSKKMKEFLEQDY